MPDVDKLDKFHIHSYYPPAHMIYHARTAPKIPVGACLKTQKHVCLYVPAFKTLVWGILHIKIYTYIYIHVYIYIHIYVTEIENGQTPSEQKNVLTMKSLTPRKKQFTALEVFHI